MNTQNYIKFLYKLIAIAEEQRIESPIIGFTEPGYFAVLMYVKWAPKELQEAAEREFVKMVRAQAGDYSPGMASCRLIVYCMREMKFKRVKEAARKLKRAPERSSGKHMSFRAAMDRIIDA